LLPNEASSESEESESPSFKAQVQEDTPVKVLNQGPGPSEAINVSHPEVLGFS